MCRPFIGVSVASWVLTSPRRAFRPRKGSVFVGQSSTTSFRPMTSRTGRCSPGVRTRPLTTDPRLPRLVRALLGSFSGPLSYETRTTPLLSHEFAHAGEHVSRSPRWEPHGSRSARLTHIVAAAPVFPRPPSRGWCLLFHTPLVNRPDMTGPAIFTGAELRNASASNSRPREERARPNGRTIR